MSQNFELLSQLEAEFHFARGTPKVVPKAATAFAVSVDDKTFAPELLTLAQTVFLSGDVNTPHSVVLCGIDRDSASSEICVSLARILAAYGALRVCLVDAHVRSPRLEKMLRADKPISFPDRTQDNCREVAQNLWLADIDTTGLPKQPGTAPVPDVKQQLAQLRQRFDFILIDTPDVNTRAEAAVFGQSADGVILIVEANVTRKAAARKATQVLEAMSVRILGSVLSNRTFPIPERLYRKL